MWLSFDELRNLHLRREFAVILPLDTVTLQGDVFVPMLPTSVVFVLEKSGDKIQISGDIAGRWLVSCLRCLAPAEAVLESHFEDAWWPFGVGEESEDFLASSFVDNDRQLINLEAYGKEIVLAHLPLRTLCGLDCRGICENCGLNLNEAECNCAKGALDPRLAVLGRLLNDKGGVLDGTTKEKDFKGSPR